MYTINVQESIFAANLKDGLRRSETAVEDEFIRRFMGGTWHGLVCSEVKSIVL